MNQQQAKFWVWWLLPFLAARALVPAGFMLDVSHGNAAVVICSADFAKNIGHSRSSDSITTHGGQHNNIEHSICPFAFSAGATLASTVLDIPDRLLSDAYNTCQQLSRFSADPASVYLARGPPALV